MSRFASLVITGLVLLAALAVFFFVKSPDEAAGFALLTAAELAERDDTRHVADASSTTRAMSVTRNSGPEIKVRAPSGFSLVSPVDFDIRVSPRNGRNVDMSSLRIEYRLGPAWVNLTNRVLKHASVSGLRFSAKGASLPSGKHKLRISIKDDAANVTQAVVSFSVN